MASLASKRRISKGGRHEPPLKMVAFVGAGHSLTRSYKCIFRAGDGMARPTNGSTQKIYNFSYDLG